MRLRSLAVEGGHAPRVLIVSENQSVPRDRRVWREAQTLTRAGYDVAVVAPIGENQDRAQFERLAGVDVHRFPLRYAASSIRSYAREYAQALWHIARIARMLDRDHPFDVVQACNPPDLLLASVWSLKRRGARFIFDHHDLVPELYLSRFSRGYDAGYRLTLALERLSFALADVVIATNDSYRDVALRRGRKRIEDVFVVRNGPDLSRFAPVPPDTALKNGRSYLLAYAGVMGPQDGVDHALRALAVLAATHNDWRAVFAGDGDELPRLRALSSRLGLDARTQFVGWVDDETLVRILSTADVCIAPEPKNPLNEISTMVKVTEYMAAGKAIAAYDLAEHRATAAGAALYAIPNRPESLAGSIATLLDDADLRKRLGKEGHERAARFSWQSQEPALLAAYERALLPEPGRGRSIQP